MWKRCIEEYGLESHFNDFEDEGVNLQDSAGVIPGEDNKDEVIVEPSNRKKAVPDKKRLLQIALFNARLTVKDGTPALLPSTDFLFIGSIGSAYNLQSLQQHGITHVLCLSEAIRLKYVDKLTYARVVLRDRVDFELLPALENCFNFIEGVRQHNEEVGRVEQKVLVHCYQGVSRSSAVCIAYLLQHCGLPLDDAVQQVRAVRPQARPNNGFMLALRRLEKQLEHC